MAVGETSGHRAGMRTVGLADVCLAIRTCVVAVESADSRPVVRTVGCTVNRDMLSVLGEKN